jgi:hypothetical protein
MQLFKSEAYEPQLMSDADVEIGGTQLLISFK